jgi:hypothetical protein
MKNSESSTFSSQKDEELFWMLGFTLGFTLGFHKLRNLSLRKKIE